MVKQIPGNSSFFIFLGRKTYPVNVSFFLSCSSKDSNSSRRASSLQLLLYDIAVVKEQIWFET